VGVTADTGDAAAVEVDAVDAAWADDATPADRGAVAPAGTPISNTPRQMEQRARTPPAGIFCGSTRKTVLQCEH
jgi:hypothetical protein